MEICCNKILVDHSVLREGTFKQREDRHPRYSCENFELPLTGLPSNVSYIS